MNHKLALRYSLTVGSIVMNSVIIDVLLVQSTYNHQHSRMLNNLNARFGIGSGAIDSLEGHQFPASGQQT